MMDEEDNDIETYFADEDKGEEVTDPEYYDEEADDE